MLITAALIFEREARRNTGISGGESGSTSGSRHGGGDLFTALRRQGLIAGELVLQVATFLRSLAGFRVCEPAAPAEAITDEQ